MESGELKKNWAWMLVLGVIFTTLGVAGLLLLPLMTITSVAVFGAFMVVGGALQIAQGIAKTKDWKSRGLHILMGIIYVIGGIATLENPVLATTVLTLVLGFSLIAIGAIRIGVAFQNKDVNQVGPDDPLRRRHNPPRRNDSAPVALVKPLGNRTVRLS
ncbi:HdeD family acid-resistance protein [Thermococcus eurythermalis]|uniref:HdeD family acid-resistance protein n=1 Tax=Thermococcus eurythermalis TaxID=1505907 RepID=UPI000B00387E|nr:DUF308 domain-containing protein [Thermococcus eurythermalis]